MGSRKVTLTCDICTLFFRPFFFSPLHCRRKIALVDHVFHSIIRWRRFGRILHFIRGFVPRRQRFSRRFCHIIQSKLRRIGGLTLSSCRVPIRNIPSVFRILVSAPLALLLQSLFFSNSTRVRNVTLIDRRSWKYQ